MHLRGGVCLVVGSTRMVSAIGDFSVGNPISGSEHNGVGEHDLHVLDCTSVFDDALPLEVRVVHILRVFRGGDVDFRLSFLTGDKRSADRGDESGLEITLVLVEVR